MSVPFPFLCVKVSVSMCTSMYTGNKSKEGYTWTADSPRAAPSFPRRCRPASFSPRWGWEVGGRLWTIRSCQQPLPVCPPSGPYQTSWASPTLISDELGLAFISKASTSFLSYPNPFFTPFCKIGIELSLLPSLVSSPTGTGNWSKAQDEGCEGSWCSCGEGLKEEMANRVSKEGQDNINLLDDQFWPLRIYSHSFPSHTKCPFITLVPPLLVPHPWKPSPGTSIPPLDVSRDEG